jgi:hypothetical protein
LQCRSWPDPEPKDRRTGPSHPAHWQQRNSCPLYAWREMSLWSLDRNLKTAATDFKEVIHRA